MLRKMIDVVIIGGGINGCGCAADAAMRGLSVLLCEEDDLASKTSSSSSKLIHGGLRYLEHFDFALVKKALSERQKLLQLAPHLVHPLPFVLPYQKKGRPLWMLRAGLFLYDHLSRANKLPPSKLIKREQHPTYFAPLSHAFDKGFLFYDCTTDDARLTLANALQAKQHGARIMAQTKLTHAEVVGKEWQLTLQPKAAPAIKIHAKTVINAAGPWVESVTQMLQIPLAHHISLVKGSHLVVPKLYEGEHAFMLQHEDKRIVFAIPYHGYTMVGTTEVAFNSAIDPIHIEKGEIDYLCSLINHYFDRKIDEADILHTWSGIRPLLSEVGKTSTALSRDYAYHFSTDPAPAVTLYGGKITTYRQLALQTINQLRAVFPHLPDSRTHTTPLPGATLDNMDFASYQHYACKKYPWLDKEIRARYLECYGTRTEQVLDGCRNMSDLGIYFGNTLYQIEVDYLINEEWAHNSDDIIWRRTKLGLTMDDQGKKALDAYLSMPCPR